jgi:hypothetical protein
MRPRGSVLVIGGLLLASAGGVRGDGQEPDEGKPSTASSRSFAVYALSRGKGVPPEARRVLDEVQDLVDEDRRRGVAVKSRRTRIGLEGETRLCIEYEDPEPARKAQRRARDIVEGVDLVNLVVGPCDESRSQPDPEEEDEP